ncbi:hypothetical protein ABPG72_009349 [Tetrahymena utriculariae]
MLKQNNYFDNLYELLQRDFSQLDEAFIDLKNNQIGDEGIANSVSYQDHFQSIKSLILQIQNCKIGFQGVSNLGNSLVKIIRLKDLTINISYNNIQIEGLKNGCCPFFNNQEFLIKMDLEARFIDMFENNEINFQNIFSLNSCLKTLSIDLNFLNCLNIQNFGEGLANCIDLSALSLEIYKNTCDQLTGIDLYLAISQCKNLNSLFISLESRDGENELTQNLRQSCLKLKRLVTFVYYLFE